MKIKKILSLLFIFAFIPCIFLFTGCKLYKQDEFCSVVFDSDGGSNVDNVTNIIKYSKIEEPTQPTKEAYTFLGWYLGETKWDFDELVVSKDMTLKAKWKLNLVNNTILSENTDYVATRVLSASMRSAELEVGNYVKLKVNSFNPKQNYLGEIIAFYNYETEEDRNVNKVLVTEYDYYRSSVRYLTSENSTIIDGDGNLNNATYSNQRYDTLNYLKKMYKVYIHQIVGIYIDDSGNVYYITKGTENLSPEYVRWDRVIGLYCENLGDIDVEEDAYEISGSITYSLISEMQFCFNDVFVSVDYGKDNSFLGNINYQSSNDCVNLPEFSEELEQSYYFTVENFATNDIYTNISYKLLNADNIISNIKVYEGDYNSLTECTSTSNNNYLVSGKSKITYKINIKFENKDCIKNNSIRIFFEAKYSEAS